MAKFRKKPSNLKFFKDRKDGDNSSEQGDEFKVHIDRLSEDGRGVAKKGSKIIFVEGALAGETVSIHIDRRQRQFDEAHLVTIDQASDDRRDPPCVYFEHCGGCDLQHLAEEKQLEHKQTTIEAKFKRLLSELESSEKKAPRRLGQAPKKKAAKLKHDINWLPPLVSETTAYRHRIRLAVEAGDKRCEIGFRRRRSHKLIDVERCLIASDGLNAALPELREILPKLGVRKFLQEVSLAEAEDKRLAVSFLARSELRQADLELLKSLSERFAEIEWRTEQKKEATLVEKLRVAETPLVVSAKPSALGQQELNWEFASGDFTQVNRALNEQMIESVLSAVSESGANRVVDFFCGLGNFSLPIAASGVEVLGIELQPSMVQRAESSAHLNSIVGCEFRSADLFVDIAKSLWAKAQLVLLDPPRAGAQNLCQQLAEHPQLLKHIVYVSCNPDTLLRDAKLLIRGGFRLSKVQIIDMFPQTQHQELLVVFERV